jgi:hypothetical protein
MAQHLAAAFEEEEGGYLLDVVGGHHALGLITLVSIEPAEDGGGGRVGGEWHSRLQ